LYLACGDETDAEDLAQEAMARAFDRWERVQAVERLIGYVFQIAFNQIAFNLHRSWLRRTGRALRSRGVGASLDRPDIAVVQSYLHADNLVRDDPEPRDDVRVRPEEVDRIPDLKNRPAEALRMCR
jgi:DNA-directed RNA polymerase specialized sigma24 family protein